jgi:hypothetical protein
LQEKAPYIPTSGIPCFRMKLNPVYSPSIREAPHASRYVPGGIYHTICSVISSCSKRNFPYHIFSLFLFHEEFPVPSAQAFPLVPGGISRTICSGLFSCSRRLIPYHLLRHILLFQKAFPVPSRRFVLTIS